jgi:hypothetical protein
MPRSSNATRPLPAGSVRVDRRGRAILPRGMTHTTARKPTPASKRADVYATWLRCPPDCEQCCVKGWDVFVPLTRKSEATMSIGNERGDHRAVGARKHAQQRAVFAALGARARRPRLPIVVLLTRTTLRASRMDRHAEWHKAIVDEVARWVGADDGDPRITWRFAHATGPVKGVRIQVKARTEAMERVFRENEERERIVVGL